MNWVTKLLIISGILMAAALIKLVFEGVRLEERQMVKWSQVDSAAEAGEKMERFLFPLIQEKKSLAIIGDGDFAQSFFQSFQQEASLNNSTAHINWGKNKQQEENFVLHIQALDRQDNGRGCEEGNMLLCSQSKALRKLNKKKLPDQSLWITMYRLGEKEAVLFYKQ